MWFDSSGTPQSGQIPVPGPLRLRTSTPDGSLPRIHCHMKMRIFSGTRTIQIIDKGRGADEGAMAEYSDLVVNKPDGSSRHRVRSGLSSTSGSCNATQSSNSRQAADSAGPNGRRKARRPRSRRALLTDIMGSTEIEKRTGKQAAKGESPAQRSYQKRVERPEPTEMEVPMRSTGRSWTVDCQNWEPPDLWQKARG